MYELIRMTENDYYIDAPAKAGVVKTGENTVVLIDSGSDKDAGKKILRAIENEGWKPEAIYTTHSHADHIGGNKLIQDRTGCKIYAAGIESAYSNFPQLEPTGLYGGLPFKELKHKFLLAQESEVLPLTKEVLPRGMELLPLPGHCAEMVGFLTPDGSAYIADCVSSEETINKYGLGYLWDPKTAKETLHYVKTVRADRFVPSHAPVTEDIAALADRNIAAITEAEDRIVRLCKEPVGFDTLLKNVFDSYGMTMTAQQFVLIGSTVRSYLSSLATEGRLTFSFGENIMKWKAAE